MKDKILMEITNFCENCPEHECCPEEECILFRIEKIVENNDENVSNRKLKED